MEDRGAEAQLVDQAERREAQELERVRHRVELAVGVEAGLRLDPAHLVRQAELGQQGAQVRSRTAASRGSAGPRRRRRRCQAEASPPSSGAPSNRVTDGRLPPGASASVMPEDAAADDAQRSEPPALTSTSAELADLGAVGRDSVGHRHGKPPDRPDASRRRVEAKERLAAAADAADRRARGGRTRGGNLARSASPASPCRPWRSGRSPGRCRSSQPAPIVAPSRTSVGSVCSSASEGRRRVRSGVVGAREAVVREDRAGGDHHAVLDRHRRRRCRRTR